MLSTETRRTVVLLSDGIYSRAAVQQGFTGHEAAELTGLIAQLLAARTTPSPR